jgi:hypothetical protein
MELCDVLTFFGDELIILPVAVGREGIGETQLTHSGNLLLFLFIFDQDIILSGARKWQKNHQKGQKKAIYSHFRLL